MADHPIDVLLVVLIDSFADVLVDIEDDFPFRLREMRIGFEPSLPDISVIELLCLQLPFLRRELGIADDLLPGDARSLLRPLHLLFYRQFGMAPRGSLRFLHM